MNWGGLSNDSATGLGWSKDSILFAFILIVPNHRRWLCWDEKGSSTRCSGSMSLPGRFRSGCCAHTGLRRKENPFFEQNNGDVIHVAMLWKLIQSYFHFILIILMNKSAVDCFECEYCKVCSYLLLICSVLKYKIFSEMQFTRNISKIKLITTASV